MSASGLVNTLGNCRRTDLRPFIIEYPPVTRDRKLKNSLGSKFQTRTHFAQNVHTWYLDKKLAERGSSDAVKGSTCKQTVRLVWLNCYSTPFMSSPYQINVGAKSCRSGDQNMHNTEIFQNKISNQNQLLGCRFLHQFRIRNRRRRNMYASRIVDIMAQDKETSFQSSKH